MIRLDTLRTCFAYNDWARDRVLDMAEGLSGDQLDRPFDMGPGSIRSTLQHLYGAERDWYAHWRGGSAGDHPAASALKDATALRTAHRGLAAERDAWLGTLSDADLAALIENTDPAGHVEHLPLGDYVLHVCNHGVHHRAQALNMLRRVGVTVRGLDYLSMRFAQPDASPALDRDTLREYYAYCDWGRDRVHAAAAGLADGLLDRTFDIGAGTLRKTLLHIRECEQWWLDNWESPEPVRNFAELDETTSVEALVALFAETAERRDALLRSMSDAELERSVACEPEPGKVYRFRLGDTMLQICGHGTHHRSQAINMLRHLGVEPPETGYAHKMRLDQAAVEIG